MPIINGRYVSKRKFSQDLAFLKSQKLSDEQIAVIQAYFYKRLNSTAMKYMLIGAGVLVVGGLINEFVR
jgi:hypothetical protein